MLSNKLSKSTTYYNVCCCFLTALMKQIFFRLFCCLFFLSFYFFNALQSDGNVLGHKYKNYFGSFSKLILTLTQWLRLKLIEIGSKTYFTTNINSIFVLLPYCPLNFLQVCILNSPKIN